jgi:hypothetical protein
MGQAPQESSRGESRQEQGLPNRGINSAQDFFKKFDERSEQIIAAQKKGHEALAKGKRPEALGTGEMLPLGDPTKWTVAQQPQVTKISEPLVGLQTRQQTGLNTLLKRQRHELATTQCVPSRIREVYGEIEKNQKKELDKLLQEQRSEVEQFYKTNKDAVKQLYQLDDPKFETLKNSRLKEVDDQIAQCRREQAEIHEDAKAYLQFHETNRKRQALMQEVGFKLPSVLITSDGRSAPPPAATIHMNLWGELSDTSRKFGNRAFITATVGDGSVNVNVNAELPAFGILNRLIPIWAIERSCAKAVDQMLIRTSDWSKPFVIKGDERTCLAIAKALAARGIDPRPAAGMMKFGDTQMTVGQQAALLKIYHDASPAAQQKADMQGVINPFEVKGPLTTAQIHEQTPPPGSTGGRF